VIDLVWFTVSVSETKYVSHHAHDRSASAVDQTGVVPRRWVWKGLEEPLTEHRRMSREETSLVYDELLFHRRAGN